MKMEQTERSETLAFKLQTPGKNPEDNIPNSKHCEILKSRICQLIPSVKSFLTTWLS
jgi:hypothetical protein